MQRPSPSGVHEDDRYPFPQAPRPRSNSAKKKESTARRLTQLCPPCATPSSNSSLDYRRSDARIVKNGFAASSGVSKSAKVVLSPDEGLIRYGCDQYFNRLTKSTRPIPVPIPRKRRPYPYHLKRYMF